MRRRLLDGTVSLLRNHPGRRPTTQQLADHAHVSIGTVYRYFADIDAIIEELRATAIGDITMSLAAGVGRAMDADPMAAMVTIVETLTAAFEKHDAVLRVSYSSAEAEFGQAWAEVEEPLLPLARILPNRLRPDLDADALDDLVFLTMGATANLCLRIALLRPPQADRAALIATAARMLLAAFDV
ncbi:helix-turn-helix domain-containing protein [Gordonia sp. CPCC 206044]|uniref:TetR/AcrR family transcriptional regulator n=1 Tax=Gordonia sp. CPCC 206044 TaxID=3140793 RepID=UPI003AF3C662